MDSLFDTIAGLPVHPLVVHATEVIVPLTAIAVLLAALWPWFRRWAGILPLGLAAASMVLVPVTKESGEALLQRVGGNEQLARHESLADGLVPWTIGLFLAALGVTWWWWTERRAAQAARADVAAVPAGAAPTAATRPVPVWLAAVLVVVALGTSVGTTVQAILVGHSGATAVWQGEVQGSGS